MSLHRACCCCECPQDLTLELRGSLPTVVSCPSTMPPVPPFGANPVYFDAGGYIGDQVESITAVDHVVGSAHYCYFNEFRRWCPPAGGTPSWPLIQDWAVTRSQCSGYSNPIGWSPCPTKFGAPPGSATLYGECDGHTVLTWASSYDVANARHIVTMTVDMPTFVGYLPLGGCTWASSQFKIRAYRNSSGACFPRGKWNLFSTANYATHGWSEKHITGFSSLPSGSGSLIYTETLNSISSPPFEIWVT